MMYAPDDQGSKERRMAMTLDACGWSKVGVDFGVGLPLAHNKICALEGEVRQVTAPTATVVLLFVCLLACWLVGWLVGWFVGCLVACLVPGLPIWLFDCWLG